MLYFMLVKVKFTDKREYITEVIHQSVQTCFRLQKSHPQYSSSPPLYRQPEISIEFNISRSFHLFTWSSAASQVELLHHLPDNELLVHVAYLLISGNLKSAMNLIFREVFTFSPDQQLPPRLNCFTSFLFTSPISSSPPAAWNQQWIRYFEKFSLLHLIDSCLPGWTASPPPRSRASWF